MAQWGYFYGLPVKTAPVENGPSPKRPHFRLKRPQFSVKTARPHIKNRRSKRPQTEKSVLYSVNFPSILMI